MFEFGCSDDFANWGHYTQLVGKDVEEIGCAAMECGNSAVGLRDEGAADVNCYIDSWRRSSAFIARTGTIKTD